MSSWLINQYVRLLESPFGGTILLVGTLCLWMAVLLWARQGALERRLLVIIAGCMALLDGAIYGVLIRLGWWGGVFVHYTPVPLQVALVVALALVAWTAWLSGYHVLVVRQFRAPVVIYLASTVLITQAVVHADRANVGGGFFVHRLGEIWWLDLAAATVHLLVPLLAYEVTRDRLARDLLP
jgi:hypothetical protein